MALLHLLLLAVIIPGYIGQSVSSVRCGNSFDDANENLNRPACTCCDNQCTPYGYSTCYAGCATTATTTAPTGSPPTSSPPTGGSVSGGTVDGSVTQTLSLTDLQNFMQNFGLTQNWCDAVNYALSEYKLNTIKRIVAFLAQVRHETAGMTVFHQTLDNGAGFLHMIPNNWKACCLAVPAIQAAFIEYNPNCDATCNCIDTYYSGANSMSDATSNAAISIFGQPTYAALAGGWWFVSGANYAFGWKGCSDLRTYCDQGLGSYSPAPSTFDNTDTSAYDCHYTGYYQVTCCIFYTIGSGSGIDQRISYYNQAIAYAEKTWGWSGSDTAEEVTQYHATPAVINAGIAVGCTVGIAALIVVIVIVYLKRKQRIQSEVV